MTKESRIIDPYVIEHPDLTKFIDKDILDELSGKCLFYGDIINVQLNRTVKELISMLKDKDDIENRYV